jgi:hypothetical protein
VFKIGDRVQHTKTGELGTVVGYGHQMVDNYYSSTIKVRLFREAGIHPILEDVFTEWLSWRGEVSTKSINQNSHSCPYAA